MAKRVGVILFFHLLFCIKLIAAPDTAHMMHFNMNTGFPSNNVYSLIQDRNGYLWFATDNGIVKYNGYSFKIFNRSNGLPANDVYQLYEDKRGRIWVYTLSYQFGYIQGDNYVSINMSGLDKTLHVKDMADNGAFLFFCFWEHNHYSMAIVKNDLVATLPLYYPIEKQDVGEVKNGVKISFCMISPNCKMWFLGFDNNLYVCDLLNPSKGYKKVCTLVQFHSKYRNDNAVTLANSNDNIVYYSFKASQLLYINTKNCSAKYVPFNNAEGESIYTIINDDETMLGKKMTTVITNTSIYTLDANFDIIKTERLSDLVKTTSQVSFAFYDQLKGSWYPTANDGVWRNYKQYGIFHSEDSLKILDNCKFVGSVPGGSTYWWDKAKGSLYGLLPNGNIRKISFSKNIGLRSISPYNDSTAYFALIDGIFKYNWASGRLTSVTSGIRNTFVYRNDTRDKQIINSDTLEKIAFGNHQALLSYDTNTFFSAFFSFHFFKRYGNDSLVCRVLSNERYTHMLRDSVNKSIIAYNFQKIFIYHPENGKAITINAAQLAKIGISNVANIEVDKYGNIYVQDDDHIALYNPLTRVGKRLNCPFNLLDAIFRICDDQIVIAGKFGIATIPINGLAHSEFKVIPNINFYYYNRIYDFVVNNNNEIVLNTDKGLYRMRLDHLRANNDFLKPFSDNFFSIVLKTPYEKKVRENDTIIIEQKLEKINLDAINLYGNGNITYKYYVPGYTKNWQQSKGEIFVSNFPPGKYYRFSCAVYDDIWNSRVVNFYIYRNPYWWQTGIWQAIFWISGSIVFIVLLLLVVFITRLIVARGNEKKRALTELELRAIHAQINPHFIFNTLSAALFFINKKRFDDAYAHVTKFSKLLRAYLKSSQDRYIILDEEIQMLKNYIELQQVRFEKKFEYNIEVDNKIPARNIQLPSLLLQPLVENAINHGLFHKEGHGFLAIKFIQGEKSDELICIIEDNGIGRQRAHAINKEDKTRKESYGTKLTQQLIDIYREYERMDISLEYTDKNGNDTGTTVKLVIKNVKYIA